MARWFRCSLSVAGPFVCRCLNSRNGTRVYLNTPDGRRVGFTFTPQIDQYGLLGASWRPEFTPDPGVNERLEVPFVPIESTADGTWSLYLFNFAYNPREYTLVTPDQMRYTYDQFDGLQSISDRNDNALTFTDSGIFSSTGQSITWSRDSLARITQIVDPANGTIDYTYTAAGDLASVTNQVADTTTFDYLSDPVHYLSTITDPAGTEVLSLQYDADGRLTATGDALGNQATQSFDLEQQHRHRRRLPG